MTDQTYPVTESATWQCHAKLHPEISECLWPDCGCEPRSTEIIAALVEQGWTPPDASRGLAQRSAAPKVDPAELWERYLDEIRADRGTPSPQGAMAFAVDALTDTSTLLKSENDA